MKRRLHERPVAAFAPRAGGIVLPQYRLSGELAIPVVFAEAFVSRSQARPLETVKRIAHISAGQIHAVVALAQPGETLLERGGVGGLIDADGAINDQHVVSDEERRNARRRHRQAVAGSVVAPPP